MKHYGIIHPTSEDDLQTKPEFRIELPQHKEAPPSRREHPVPPHFPPHDPQQISPLEERMPSRQS